MEYTPVIFTSYQSVGNERKPIYHTNVMMALGEQYAVVCLECIDDKQERKNLTKQIKSSGKELITITEDQVSSFAGNMMQVKNEQGDKFLVMSDQAYNSLNKDQVTALEIIQVLFPSFVVSNSDPS